MKIIDILRNSPQKFGVYWGGIFESLGVQKMPRGPADLDYAMGNSDSVTWTTMAMFDLLTIEVPYQNNTHRLIKPASWLSVVIQGTPLYTP